MSASMRSPIFYAQHFLQDSCLVASLVKQSSISRQDTVYEIGPGRGIITEQLAWHARQARDQHTEWEASFIEDAFLPAQRGKPGGKTT